MILSQNSFGKALSILIFYSRAYAKMNNNLSYLKEQEKFLCKMQGMNINCLSVHISKTLSQCSYSVKMFRLDNIFLRKS